jgi:hypothetical protein
MNPTVALMLSKTIEDDRRRELARRKHRFVEPETPSRHPSDRRAWSLPFPRFGESGSKA